LKAHKGIRGRQILVVLVCVILLLLVLLSELIVQMSGSFREWQAQYEEDTVSQTEESPPDSTQSPEITDGAQTAPPTETQAGTERETAPEQTEAYTEPETEAAEQTPPRQQTNTPAPTPPVTEEIAQGSISCVDIGRFSGQYVEDGRDELVENVAAILVRNDSDQYLELATLTFDTAAGEAVFIVTGLPAHRSAWVMEANRMTVAADAQLVYRDSITSFKDGVTAETDRLEIVPDIGTLTVTNVTDETLEDIFVCYRTIHADGIFLGGITYRVEIGDLGPGESRDTLAGHYKPEVSEIVRIGWR